MFFKLNECPIETATRDVELGTPQFSPVILDMLRPHLPAGTWSVDIEISIVAHVATPIADLLKHTGKEAKLPGFEEKK
jgi:hypothetical protein